MKKVRLAMMAAVMFLGVSTVARAQDPQQQSRGNRPNMAAMLFKDITLTPVQQAKVDSITGKYREQMQALAAISRRCAPRTVSCRRSSATSSRRS